MQFECPLQCLPEALSNLNLSSLCACFGELIQFDFDRYGCPPGPVYVCAVKRNSLVRFGLCAYSMVNIFALSHAVRGHLLVQGAGGLVA